MRRSQLSQEEFLMGKKPKQTGAVSSYFSSNLLARGGEEVALVPNQLDVREQNSLLNWSVQSFPRSSDAMNPKRHTVTQSATDFTLWFSSTLSCGPGNRCIAFQIPRQSHNLSAQSRKYLSQPLFLQWSKKRLAKYRMAAKPLFLQFIGSPGMRKKQNKTKKLL